MGATGVKGPARAASAALTFSSAAELRAVLEEMLRHIDADPEAGPLLRAADTPVRLEVSDLGLVLNTAASDDPRHCVQWRFSDRVPWKPKLELTMDSEVANRYLQGKENVAIAIARGRIKASCEARVALRYFLASKGVFRHYRELIERDHPSLLIG